MNAADKDSLKTDDQLKKCLCKKCRSFSNCKEVGGYCISTISGSRCITDEKECLCRKCRVHKENNHRFQYYCTKKSEEQQSEMG